MYYPYFRGKQFELLAVRDTAELLAQNEFVPIIEPVKAQLKGMVRALDAICDAGGSAIVVINPEHGDYSSDGQKITEMLNDNYLDRENISAGIILTENTTTAEAMTLNQAHADHGPVFIHAGFMEARELSASLGQELSASTHVFFEQQCKKLYRKHFDGSKRILLRDGFVKRRNADYKPVESFSDLHVTFPDEGMDGFGDFLTVGDDYSESGGPAYAVAIHLTFIDQERDEEMFVYHFVSVRKDTPADPAGKFAEALTKLREKYESGTSQLFLGTALQQYLDLDEKGHFPGLGQAKKLSMIHHIETLADYLS
ncbi:MAG: sce7725 family protein [Shimia sp.]|uniref:sce7725 family protein n=1 Tax=Shimia sp. TaxID=1954381 RepID=UPI003B8D7217